MIFHTLTISDKCFMCLIIDDEKEIFIPGKP